MREGLDEEELEEYIDPEDINIRIITNEPKCDNCKRLENDKTLPPCYHCKYNSIPWLRGEEDNFKKQKCKKPNYKRSNEIQNFMTILIGVVISLVIIMVFIPIFAGVVP